MAKRKNEVFVDVGQPKVQNRRPWWQWLVIAIIGLCTFSYVGQLVGILPDATEMAATKTAEAMVFDVTALIADATRQQVTAVAAMTIASMPTATDTLTPVPTDTPADTATPLPTDKPADTATSAPTQTMQPATVALGFTPEFGLAMTTQPTIYYVTNLANLRSCPRLDCGAVVQLGAGEAVTADATINGESVNPGNAIWYRVKYSGREAYVYSDVVSLDAPVVNFGGESNNTAPVATAPAGVPVIARPGNCSTAVAMGLSAQQAAQSGLDRDGDGVACYGD